MGNITPPLNAKVLEALRQPFVDGIYLTLAWSDVEPTEGAFNWQAADEAVAAIVAAGKKISIGVSAGRFAPAWVSAQLPAMRTVAPGWNVVGGPHYGECIDITIPLPWNEGVQAKFGAMLKAFGQHYATNPAVVSVKVEGLNTNTPELMWPHFTGEVVAKCKTHDDVALAISMGATKENIVAAFKRFLGDVTTAFPEQYVVVQGCGVAAKPAKGIGSGGHSEPVSENLCAEYMVPYARSHLGSRFVIQNNAWNVGAFAKEDAATAVEYGKQKNAINGMQLANPLEYDCPGPKPCDPLTTLDIMASEIESLTSTRYVEVFPGGVNDPKLETSWKRLRAWLLRPGR